MRPGSLPSVPFIVDFQGGPSKDGAAIILKIGLSDGRKFSGALPLGGCRQNRGQSVKFWSLCSVPSSEHGTERRMRPEKVGAGVKGLVQQESLADKH
jgi:hypothetical protein